MEKSPSPTEEQSVKELEGVNKSDGSEADAERTFHTSLRLAARGPESSSARGKKNS